MVRIGCCVLAVAGALVLGAGQAGAQGRKPETQPAAPAAPDAKAVLKAARSAILTTRTATYNARCEGTGVTAGSFPTYNAVVGIQRMITGSPVMAKVSVRGESTRPGGQEARPFHFVYDGQSMRWRDADGKVAQAEPGEGHAALLAREELILVPHDLLLEEPLTHVIDTGTASYEGRRSVEGTECDVLLLEYTPRGAGVDKPIRARWFLGAQDHLPRRVEYPTKIESSEGKTVGEAGVMLTLAQLQPNARLEPSMFRLSGGDAKADPKARPAPPPLKERARLLAVGDDAPDWVLQDAAGKEQRLSDHKGKVVVLDFWATWCPPCRAIMPHVQSLHEKHKDQGLVVVGVSAFERKEPVEGPAKYMQQQGFTYGLLVKGDQVARGYGVSAIPTMYVIGRDGRVAFVSTGAGDMEGVARAIERQLKK